jgi:tRNA pseudouridine38-40 synthase|uniref:tRNA pseudouridine synthase A n=1 Tax=candidate division WOR-3 bacterium TaxID=2052148 RepID=A0A7C6EDP9_UNCW3
MRNILLEIEFDGNDYFGWQYQPKRKTVQGTIEAALQKILQEPVTLIGASRTDAGVSAQAQFANFITNSQLSVKTIQNGLNSLLPRDIYIRNACSVHLRFNARFDAKSKVYRYQIINGRSPLQQRFAWEVKYPLNINKMKQAAKLFVGSHDFRPFCAIKKEQEKAGQKEGIVDIKRVDIRSLEANRMITIEIEADRFLYKMVRRIVGCLVEVGRGKRTKNDIKLALAGKPHPPFLVAPAKGLTLLMVKY